MSKVQFKDTEGNTVVGILSDPSDKQKLVIILCHGFSSSKDSSTYVNLERMLNEKGFATLRFDFYGHGESEGKFEDVTITRSSNDILSAIEFLKSEGYTKIGLFGASFGGISSIIAASKTDDLCLLVLKCPVSEYTTILQIRHGEKGMAEWNQNGFIWYESGKHGKLRLNYSFFEDSKINNGYKAAENIIIPTFIIHGDADDVVPVEQSKKTALIIKDCRLEIIPGANHHFDKKEDYDKVLDLTVEFIEKNS